MAPTPTPTNIRALREAGVLEITWPDQTSPISFKRLRGACPCAQCVDEITGVRILDVDAISEDIQPVHVSITGNYALKIAWSDGHDTGLFTWESLRKLTSEAAE